MAETGGGEESVMSKCIYSHDDGAYCDKFSHGAVTMCCVEAYGKTCQEKKIWTNYDRIHSMDKLGLAKQLVSEQTVAMLSVFDALDKIGCGTSPIREELGRVFDDAVKEKLEWLEEEAQCTSE